jgi:hypothetical protein
MTAMSIPAATRHRPAVRSKTVEFDSSRVTDHEAAFNRDLLWVAVDSVDIQAGINFFRQ